MKYTCKMPLKLSAVYHAILFATFIPPMAMRGLLDVNPPIILWVLFGLAAAFGIVHRVFCFCQLRDEGLYVSPERITIAYSSIIGVVEYTNNDLEIEYMVNDTRRVKNIRFVSRNNLQHELLTRMRG